MSAVIKFTIMLYTGIIWVRVEIRSSYWVHIFAGQPGQIWIIKKSGPDLDLVLTVLLEYFAILSLKVQSY